MTPRLLSLLLRYYLDVSDHVNLHQRIARNSARGGNRSAHRRFRPEAALEGFIHAGVVLQVVEIDVALQDLFHGGADALQLLLDGIQHNLGMGCLLYTSDAA